MQTETEIGAANDARIFLGLQPAGAQLHAASRKTGEQPLETLAASAVAGDQQDKIGESSSSRGGFPPANAIFELERQLKINEDVLRYITVKVDQFDTSSSKARRDDKPEGKAEGEAEEILV